VKASNGFDNFVFLMFAGVLGVSGVRTHERLK
jgi:hypothetical protein